MNLSDEKKKFDFMKKYKEEQDALESMKKGLVYFIVGMALMAGGLFMIFQNTIISTNFTLMDILGFTPPTGIIILPLLIGIAALFFNGKSVIGWVLVILGIVTILLGLLMGLRMTFRPVTLYQGILMFGMTAAGAGLFLKAFFGVRK